MRIGAAARDALVARLTGGTMFRTAMARTEAEQAVPFTTGDRARPAAVEPDGGASAGRAARRPDRDRAGGARRPACGR